MLKIKIEKQKTIMKTESLKMIILKRDSLKKETSEEGKYEKHKN